MERHYGMDWLRIGAFAVLILYHVGMVYVPWGYHVNARPTSQIATLPMLFPNAWRLMLLFVVSGFASRALLFKQGNIGAFLRNRSLRLLLPLAFGIIVLVPPQSWVELVTQHRYGRDFLSFYLHDYFRFRMFRGVVVPAWNHLWFVAYLWVYSVALGLLVALVRTRALQRLFDRLFAGWGLMTLPLAYLLLVRLVLAREVAETHGLIDDVAGHLSYLPAFLFGFALAGSASVFDAIRRQWKVAGLLALLSFAVVLAIQWIWLREEAPPLMKDAFYAARAFQAWCSIVALIGIADRFWNRDRRWRPALTQAVFPFYLIHQTIIVVAAFWLLPFRLPYPASFALLVLVTALGCWAFYGIGRMVPSLRPLIGLKRLSPAARESAQPVQ